MSGIEMRADARANRDRIVDAARDAFARSSDASLNSIAKQAGVGAGTLYRHFPSREALVLAVYHKEIVALVELASELLKREAPLLAFRAWCDRLADYGRVKRGLTAILHTVISDRDYQQSYWPMVGALQSLLDACAASGDMLPDRDGGDILLLLGFLWRVAPGEDAGAQADRLIDVVIRGLQRR